MSLRDRLNALGINGVEAQSLIDEYHQLTLMERGMTMDLFLQTVKDTILCKTK